MCGTFLLWDESSYFSFKMVGKKFRFEQFIQQQGPLPTKKQPQCGRLVVLYEKWALLLLQMEWVWLLHTQRQRGALQGARLVETQLTWSLCKMTEQMWKR